MLGRLLPAGWEQSLNLQAEGDRSEKPVAHLLWSRQIPKCLKGSIEGLATETEDPPKSTANWHGPAPAFMGSPVRGDDRGTGEIPAIGKILVDEWLDEHGVDLATAFASERPDIVNQHAGHKRT